MKGELEDVLLVKRLACVNPEVPSACIKTLVVQVKDADAKYAKMVKESSEVEEAFGLRATSLKSSLKAESDCMTQAEKVLVDKATEDDGVLVDQSEAYDVIKCQLKEREEDLREARVELTAATSNLKRFCDNVKDS